MRVLCNRTLCSAVFAGEFIALSWLLLFTLLCLQSVPDLSGRCSFNRPLLFCEIDIMINGQWTSLHETDGGHQNLLMAFWNNNLHLSWETTMLDNRNLVWLGVSFTHYVWKISCYQLKPLLYYTYFISIGNLGFSVFFTFRYVSHLMEVKVWSGVVSLLV